MKRLANGPEGTLIIDKLTFVVLYNAAVDWANAVKDRQDEMETHDMMGLQVLMNTLVEVKEELIDE